MYQGRFNKDGDLSAFIFLSITDSRACIHAGTFKLDLYTPQILKSFLSCYQMRQPLPMKTKIPFISLSESRRNRTIDWIIDRMNQCTLQVCPDAIKSYWIYLTA